jgi:hypothetical protein
MKPAWMILIAAAAPVVLPACAQGVPRATERPADALIERGEIDFGGHSARYVIRHLPVSSFPALPQAVQAQLEQRGCLIPQTYEAHRPENVVHASLEARGTSDWAALCSVQGTVSLLVFFADGSKPAMELASAPETERLQVHDVTGVLGFNWGIDPASPKDVADAESGVTPRPPPLDHDALADSVVEHKTMYHYYAKGGWRVMEGPE